MTFNGVNTRSFAALLAATSLSISPAFAHHSISGYYDMDQRATVEGEVVQFQYRNPHSFVELRAKDPNSGAMVNYSVEWNGAGRLEKDGVTPETLKPGDRVVVTGQPGRKAEEHRLHVVTISRPSDGWKWNRKPRY